MTSGAIPHTLDAVDRRLLDEFQRDFPVCSQPYAVLGERLGIDEAEVLERLRALSATGAVSRIGAVLSPNRYGVSTLAAMAVPLPRLEEIAVLVSAYAEVNHNYEREHVFNLWFVVTAEDRPRLNAVLKEIGERSGLQVLDLPLEEEFFIDLGFPLQWN